jgi:hypothetical protein
MVLGVYPHAVLDLINPRCFLPQQDSRLGDGACGYRDGGL